MVIPFGVNYLRSFDSLSGILLKFSLLAVLYIKLTTVLWLMVEKCFFKPPPGVMITFPATQPPPPSVNVDASNDSPTDPDKIDETKHSETTGSIQYFHFTTKVLSVEINNFFKQMFY